MGTGTSIVGTWNTFVDWGDTGSAIIANPFTFNADGTWSYAFGGGQWVQVEGMCFFNFNNAPGLIYTANVTADTVSGIMGYPGSSTGAWWGTHLGAPHAAAAESLAERDVAVGPVEG